MSVIAWQLGRFNFASPLVDELREGTAGGRPPFTAGDGHDWTDTTAQLSKFDRSLSGLTWSIRVYRKRLFIGTGTFSMDGRSHL
jgi:hypothetical protein